MSSIKPYYRRRRFTPTLGEADLQADGRLVDFAKIPAPDFGSADPVAQANAQYDDRAAAVIAAATGLGDVHDVGGKAWPKLRFWTPISWSNNGILAVPSEPWFQDYDLCEFKWTKPHGGVRLMRGAKCLSV